MGIQNENRKESESIFSSYMREQFRKKGITQQEIFRAANISEKYGYKLISGEKHTKQRDQIVKICLSARFDILETDRALMLYGMSPLYKGNPRDVVLIRAFEKHMYEVCDVNDNLEKAGFNKLYESGRKE